MRERRATLVQRHADLPAARYIAHHTAAHHPSLREGRIRRHDDTNNDPKEPKSAAKDLDDQNLDKHVFLLGMRKRAAAPRDAYRDTTEEVG